MARICKPCALVIAALGGMLGLGGCAARADLPSYSTVPNFTLTDQTGSTFKSAPVLDGHVWIADFMFTTCPGPCPRMSSQMRQVQKALEGSDARLVSFTVDPQRDTPQVLAQYAKNYSAKPGVWYFLTGPTATLDHLDRDVFHLGDVDGSLEHSTRFILVDRHSKVRGFYLTSEQDAISRVIADAKNLLRDRS
ncbi:MAG TPA: SCO family protein [Bryobacteraceae bacterium]|nr:SCO family protein [Bryobacteraceae bacterium]